MLQMVVLIVNDPDDCPAVLEAWEALGVSGITILETSGLGRYRYAGMRDDLPLMPRLQDLFEGGEVHHRTLFSVVEGDEIVEKMIAAAQQEIGNLEEEHTGFLFVLPVSRAVGLGTNRPYMQKK
jgi:nitrogen regulatory protein PII